MGNLLIHRRIHNNERCEQCTFCEKRFVDPSTLRSHIKYIHNKGHTQKPFICRKCHKAFTKKTSLRNHLLSDCNQCAASFTVKSNLNRHLKKIHGASNID